MPPAPHKKGHAQEGQKRFLVGSDAPGPLLISRRLRHKLPIKVEIDKDLLEEKDLLPAVENYHYQVAFSSQDDMHSLAELTKYSQLPVFRSNLSSPDYPAQDRVPVRIADPKNRIDFYAVYRKDQRKSVAPLLDLLSKNWPSDYFSD